MSLRTMPQHFSFSSPGNQSGRADFGNTVRAAAVPIQGFSLSFGNDDHNLLAVEVVARNVAINGTVVTYDVSFNLRDDSNNVGKGEIDIVVIADVEAAS
jgi:hypothetical protein